MFFFFGDEEAPLDAPKVFKVERLSDCKNAFNNLKDLEEQINCSNSNCDDYLTEAINEQKKQISDFRSKHVFDSAYMKENLNTLLKQHDMQISTLENLLEISAGYISRTLGRDSKKKMSIDVVWNIADLFNVNIDDLLNRDLTAPTGDMKKVIDFVSKLKKDVDAGNSHWKQFNNRNNEYKWLFFRNESENVKYIPIEYGSFIGDVDDIHYLETRMGAFFLVKGFGMFDDNVCYELYQYDDEEYNLERAAGFDEQPRTLIAETYMETTGTLKCEIDELYKSIKLHERDFVISETAKKIIDNFLNYEDNSSNTDLPFE